MAIETYDARSVNVIVAGAVITGFAEGSFVKIARNAENFTTYIGAKGEVARSRNADRTATITLTLKHTSPSNRYLSELAKSDDTFAANVNDGSQGSIIGGVDCWVSKQPDMEFADKITSREWQIVVPELDVAL